MCYFLEHIYDGFSDEAELNTNFVGARKDEVLNSRETVSKRFLDPEEGHSFLERWRG